MSFGAVIAEIGLDHRAQTGVVEDVGDHLDRCALGNRRDNGFAGSETEVVLAGGDELHGARRTLTLEELDFEAFLGLPAPIGGNEVRGVIDRQEEIASDRHLFELNRLGWCWFRRSVRRRGRASVVAPGSPVVAGASVGAGAEVVVAGVGAGASSSPHAAAINTKAASNAAGRDQFVNLDRRCENVVDTGASQSLARILQWGILQPTMPSVNGKRLLSRVPPQDRMSGCDRGTEAEPLCRPQHGHADRHIAEALTRVVFEHRDVVLRRFGRRYGR